MAQSILIEKTSGYLSKVHLLALRDKGETGKNREKKPHQPFLSGLPNSVNTYLAKTVERSAWDRLH
jgi:hypothetical protein